MRLPIKRKNGASVLSLPNLSGGLNLRDGISEILDNQMTDCENMWWQDGILKTRPGITFEETAGFEGVIISAHYTDIKLFPNIKRVINEQEYILQARRVFLVREADNGYIQFAWVNKNESITIGGAINNVERYTTFFVCTQKNTLYCFLSNEKIFKYDIEEDSGWEDAKGEVHVPTVLIQCEKITGTNATKEQVLSSGVMLEGFNILSDYYKMRFNSYNPEIVTADNPSHEMRYHIVESVANKEYAGKTVTAEYKGVTHTVTLSGEKTASVETKLNTEDNLQMRVWKNSVSFWDAVGDNGKIVMISEGDEDDLVITAPYISSNTDKAKVFGMTQSVWFGGGNAGLQGGTRLFLCGNTSEPSLVVWSSLNNPLYFPENSYFYVGESSSLVTGFGKQSDMLVIFKERETWCTTYRQNTNITAESLINQSVVDLTAASVYFPLVQINPNIGCGYPDSVQLCRNRLVWLGGDDKVYTLVSESAYNERSIFCVSEMIERKLSPRASTVTSCDWDGYYCLGIGSEMFLMDYNCYGFTHIASHAKTEDANIKIPWYYWKLPIHCNLGLLNGDILIWDCNDIQVTVEDDESAYQMITYKMMHYSFSKSGEVADKIVVRKDLESFDVDNIPILSTATTKLFDFGAPHVRKNIEQVNLQLGNNDGKEIKVHFITENGSEETEVYLDGTETESYTAGYIDSRAVFPCIKQVLRFGLKIESQGKLAVDSVIIKYRNTGGAR